MAVRKIQIRPPENDYADVLHPETDTTMVLLPDGSVLQDQLVAPLASGSATALVIDMPGITSYTHGKLFQFIASANNNGAASTLKVGTLPARPIYLEGTTNTAPNLIAGKLYTVWADNTKNCFFLKASGSGNAVAADLLAGKTATTDLGNIVGTMPHNGSQDATLTITGSAKPTKVIPAGYTWGGTITAQLDSSLASSIKSGITIGGVTGTYAPSVRIIKQQYYEGSLKDEGKYINLYFPAGTTCHMILIGYFVIWASDPNVPVLPNGDYNAGGLNTPVWVYLNAVYEDRVRLYITSYYDRWCNYKFTVYLIGY
jgi:hypothetical protein